VRQFLETLLGPENVLHGEKDLEPYRQDYTEADPVDPSVVALVTKVDQIQAIVREAAQRKIPVTPRVAGTNVGGLTIPAEGGLVVDMTRMNRIIEVNVEDMYAVIEPGVTQRDMKEHLADRNMPLTLGYSLAPPHVSVLANAINAGLTTRSLRYGDQSDWISGLEVVLPDGSLARTGAWALSDVPYGRVPFPDLTGLFVSWSGTTGIVTKCAFQLWPRHPLEKRLFILCYSASAAYKTMRRLSKGIKKPHPHPSGGEPIFFLYVDMTAETQKELDAKCEILESVIEQVRMTGERLDDPLEVETLVSLNPLLEQFSDFPVDLKFLTDHGGGGLSWIGTYGPLSRFEEAADACMEVMARHGFPPLIVSRAMRGGHFGVLRLISTFDKSDPDEVEAVRVLNHEILETVTGRGFVMYKTPAWAWKALVDRIDPGMIDLMRRVRRMLDPGDLLNPGKLP
jgi:glycolate oxidase